jgi:hypothetical protein
LFVLEREYGSNFVTLPAFAASHFLTGTVNPARMDWALNAEMAGSAPEVFRNLERDNVYALVDLRERAADPTGGMYGSDLSTLVENHWRLLNTGTWYKVYAAPDYVVP